MEQSFMIRQLLARLDLPSGICLSDIETAIDTAQKTIKDHETELRTAKVTMEHALNRLKSRVRKRWPELYHGLVPFSIKLATEQAIEFETFVSSPGAYDAMQSAKQHIENLDNELLEIRRREAKQQRLLRICKNVVLEKNLPLVASSQVVQTYEKLVSMERGSLSPR